MYFVEDFPFRDVRGVDDEILFLTEIYKNVPGLCSVRHFQILLIGGNIYIS